MKDAESQLERAENKKFHSCGVWPLASYINHSCYSNVRRSFIGDMMIVRATQDLIANTELVFWYTLPSDIPSSRVDITQKFRNQYAKVEEFQ